MTRLTYASLLMLAVPFGCARPARVPDSTESVGSTRFCAPGTQWERTATGSESPQGVDVDCDGTVDTVRVEILDSLGARYWRMVATIRGVQVRETSPWEAKPELVGAVDLDADRILDLLFAVVDESSLVPWVVGVAGERSKTFPIAGAPSAYQYRFAAPPSDACLAAATPQVSVDARGRGAIRVWVNTGEPSGDCPRGELRMLRWSSDSLRAEPG